MTPRQPVQAGAADIASLRELPEPVVSIVVPCRNEAGHIESFLNSLTAQNTQGLSCEVLIADGGSTDGTRAAVEKYSRSRGGITLIHNPEGTVSTGLNRAIRAARGVILLRMDVHTEYAPDYVFECVRTLLSTGADNVGGPARTRPRGYWGKAIAVAYHSAFACGGAKFHQPDYEGWVDTVPYGCWWKAIFERVGLFDEHLVRNQDDEFNLRIMNSGGRIWQSPKIVSWYSPRNSLRNLFRQYFQYGFWKVAVVRKHGAPAAWRHLVPVVFVMAQACCLALIAATAILGSMRLLQAAMILWSGILAAYLAVALAVSLRVGIPHGWRISAVLPLVFGAYHFSYGLGFSSALFSAFLPGGHKRHTRGAFSGLTRQ